MSTLRSLILAIATAAALAACSYNPNYEGAACSPGGICPGDLVCDTDNVCRADPSGGIDAATDDADPGDPDAATDGGMEIDGAPDVTPPNTTIQSAPSAISGPSVTFIVDSTEAGSTFRCSVDSTVLMSCTATQMFSGLAAGTHTFRAAATDMAGNEDPTPVEYTWMVDLNVLDTTITMGPSGTSGPAPTFRFTSTRPGTFECMPTPGESAFTACASPKSYTALTEVGAPGYTFQVRARDTAGNIDDTPAMQTFLVDATGPTVAISTPSVNGVVGTSFNLAFNVEAGATYTCQLDSGTVINPCANGRSFTGLTSAAAHTIRVTGTDSFGNVGPATTNTFNVDDLGPSVTIGGTPTNGSTVATTSAALTFQIQPTNEPAPFSFECRFDTAAVFTACTGFNQSGLADGSHTLRVRAKDRFNNVGGEVTHTWTISPMTTTILAIRQGIALGTRVRISTNVRVTGKTNNRFWVQEVDGSTAITVSRGITVGTPALDAQVTPGRQMTITGTVANLNGNLALSPATYIVTGNLTPYQPRSTSNDSLVLLSELNEGMYTTTGGRHSTTAAPTCQDYDFCIVSCESSTPVIDSVDAVVSGQLMPTRYHTFDGVLEGAGSGFVYYVTGAAEQSDICL